MAVAGDRPKAEKQLREITECSICYNAFTDPRILQCIHTFCVECLKRTAEEAQKKPGDKMPCPLCRKEFIIPKEGIVGLQKNFFMENLMESLLELKNALQSNHPILKIGRETEKEIRRMPNVKSCTKHTQKPLDYYCADCKKIVCVSCFVESHRFHDCKDVTTVDEEFRQTIEKKAWKISTFAYEIMSIRKNTEKRRVNFLKEIVECENEIHERNQELKDLIDRDTTSLLDELSAIKSNHKKQIENEIGEIDRSCTILRSFEAYCTELRAKGSASDICSSVDQLFLRAAELERDHEAFIGRPRKSVDISFLTGDLGHISQKYNLVGQVKETKAQFENCAIVVGITDGSTIKKDVIKINLHRPNEISTKEQIPTTMEIETVAAVNGNTLYVTGVGANNDEIWKYQEYNGWLKCASLVQGRRRHSAAFMNTVLYLCGGFVSSNGSVLDSVETYNPSTWKCTIVGKLVHCVQASGNCVPFKSSLFIFGGLDKDKKAFNHVQVYNTNSNTCTLLSKPMPFSSSKMRAALWETSIILVGHNTCFIFNFETVLAKEKTLQDRCCSLRFGS